MCIRDRTNAGVIFIGKWTPEAMGDYILGPSHVLPTGGSASFSSPLSSLDFIKYSSVTKISDKGLKLLGKNVEVMAESESLFAHKNSISLSSGISLRIAKCLFILSA